MFNLKTLAIATLTGMTILAATPAEAQRAFPSNRVTNTAGEFCAFSTNRQNDYFTDSESRRCTVTRRVNSNGHTVYDVQIIGGGGTWSGLTSVVLWNDGTAEYWQEGDRFTGRFVTNDNGGTVVFSNHSDYHFVF